MVSKSGGSTQSQSSYAPEVVNVWNPQQIQLWKSLASRLQTGTGTGGYWQYPSGYEGDTIPVTWGPGSGENPNYYNTGAVDATLGGAVFNPSTGPPTGYDANGNWIGGSPTWVKGTTGDVPSYPGQLYVPTTSQEQKYFNDVGDLQKSLALARTSISNPAYTIDPQTTLDEFQKIYAQPEAEQYANVTLPGINAAYAGPGYWGSARANAVSNALQGLGTTEGTQYGQLELSDIAAQRQAALQEQNLMGTAMPTLASAESNILGTAGQYARSIAQQQIASDYLRWTSGETVDGVTPTQYNPFMQAVFEALGLNQFVVASQGQSSSTGSQSGFGINLGNVFDSAGIMGLFK